MTLLHSRANISMTWNIFIVNVVENWPPLRGAAVAGGEDLLHFQQGCFAARQTADKQRSRIG